MVREKVRKKAEEDNRLGPVGEDRDPGAGR